MARVITGTQDVATRFYEQFGSRAITFYERTAEAGDEDIAHRAPYYKPKTTEQVRALANRLIEIGGADLVSLAIGHCSGGNTTQRHGQIAQTVKVCSRWK